MDRTFDGSGSKSTVDRVLASLPVVMVQLRNAYRAVAVAALGCWVFTMAYS
jgi:hypothetical protein